jgi:hypothetical protein
MSRPGVAECSEDREVDIPDFDTVAPGGLLRNEVRVTRCELFELLVLRHSGSGDSEQVDVALSDVERVGR